MPYLIQCVNENTVKHQPHIGEKQAQCLEILIIRECKAGEHGLETVRHGAKVDSRRYYVVQAKES